MLDSRERNLSRTVPNPSACFKAKKKAEAVGGKMSSFKGSMPIPKYDTGTVVAYKITDNETEKIERINSIKIQWIDKLPPEIRYRMDRDDHFYLEEAIRYELKRGEQ
jgi:hypothetical protein